MFTPWADFDRNFALMDELRRRMSRMFEEYEGTGLADQTGLGWASRAWPRANLFDTGNALVVRAEIPGLTEKDIKLSFQEDVLTLSGQRETDAPRGYAIHRQERGPVKFSRSFTFPTRVDAEKATADLKDGILTVTLPKHPDSQPREITVKGA